MSAESDLIYKGAEGNIYRTKEGVLKERAKKSYRLGELDERIRRLRTRHEAKILEKLGKAGLSVPKVLKASERECAILLEDLKGETLKEVLSKAGEAEAAGLARKIGELVKKIHDFDVVHNDLTTSNMIYAGGRIHFIDWGLGYHTTRVEDKAMDLVVFRKSLRATHPLVFEAVWGAIKDGYGGDPEVFSRVEDIERRVRYA